MTAAFPTSTPSMTDYVGTEKLGTAELHSARHNRTWAELLAVIAKLGLSAASPVDAPAANLVLVSDATGKSKWSTIVSAMIADGTIAAGDLGLGWSTFTITNLVQGSNLSGFSTQYARYMTLGKRTRLSAMVTVTNATGATGGYPVALEVPVGTLGTPSHTGSPERCKGSMLILRSGVAWYLGAAAFNTTTYIQGTADGGTNWMGINAPAITLVANDIVVVDAEYEIN